MFFESFSFSFEFVTGFLSIVLIDLILAGDNAVIIAMAVRSLPARQRARGIFFGSGTAVVLRVGLTFVAARLLSIGLVKLAGGVLITWIAIKLFAEVTPEDGLRREACTLRQAVATIVVADLVMSTDNILAVAGASHGSLFLLVFGLGLSIPFVIFTSHLLSTLMDKYAFILYLGAAVLGRVAGEMIVTDPYVRRMAHPGPILTYSVETLFTVGVVVAGWLRVKSRETRLSS